MATAKQSSNGFSVRVLALATMAAAVAPAAHEPAHAWTLKTLHSFCAEANCADGSSPVAGLVRDAAGNLYGTTEIGGNDNGGVVFEASPAGNAWSYNVLHSFCDTCGDGAGPIASLILDVNGNLYGTTVEKGGARRGCGTVFRLSPPASRRGKWKETLLHVFSCKPFGDQATSALTYQGKQSGALYDGLSPLYGTTVSGGTGAGTVYRLVPDGATWKHKTIYAFCPNGTDGCTDGRAPGSDLIFDGSGTLYGMTGVGGSTNNGIVYRLKLSAKHGKWREAILYNFCQLEDCTDGALPAGALVEDTRGRFFGTSNGPSDAGNIFELARKTGWHEKAVHIFDPGDCGGYNPEAGLLLDSAGTLYGTTSIGGCKAGFGGTVFSFKGKTYSTLYTFCSLDSCADGEGSVAPVIMDPSGNLYGTTVLFGANGDGGTVFELSP